MLTFTTFDSGYSWWFTYGYLIPLVLFGALTAVAAWRRWPRWLTILSGVVAAWSLAGLALLHLAMGINRPLALPSEAFLASARGHVLDVGAGSGRATLGVLQARPGTRVTALDIYSGYFGIDDNTPERLLANARAAGVADRVDARVGDMRDMPFADATFDAAISSYAVDHVPRRDVPKALGEVARVLRPGGEFLLLIVNADAWAMLISPHGLGHHFRPDPARWTAMLEASGFAVLEQGRKPATLYFLGRKGGLLRGSGGRRDELAQRARRGEIADFAR
jgi:SAM-dependent methyltransferase